MPMRIIVAYVMIAALLFLGVALLRYVTRERRSYARAVRRHRRANKGARTSRP